MKFLRVNGPKTFFLAFRMKRIIKFLLKKKNYLSVLLCSLKHTLALFLSIASLTFSLFLSGVLEASVPSRVVFASKSVTRTSLTF